MKLDRFTDTIVLEPASGTNISACLKEALELALQYDVKIKFLFNGRECFVNPWKVVSDLHPEGL